MSYYQILQAEAEQKEIRLWRPLARIYELAGADAVLLISLLLGVGALYFGWRNYKIKNSPLRRDKSANDEIFEPQDKRFYKATEQDIRDLEKQIGFLLPQDYRAFLLRYNGGFPTACVLNDNIIIDYFYYLVTDNREVRLSDVFKKVPNYGYGLPIATTLAGDILILSAEGEILFFDIEIMTDDDGAFISEIEYEPEWVTESFTALLEQLY
ncbi:SMI1/KNR4 family protein [Rodentibacter trehalosifermentans]|nr:SMI1/KNR4 family protein [Rodentibacter trehalosifermentans]